MDAGLKLASYLCNKDVCGEKKKQGCIKVCMHARVNTVSPDMANHGHFSHTNQSNAMQQ